MSKLYAGLAVAVVAGLVGGSLAYVYARSTDAGFEICREGAVGGGAIGGPFTLINGQGQEVTDQQVLSRPSLVYFGYSFCPDVCPFDNARNAEAVDLLAERGFDVQPVFISVDPERDTAEVMQDYQTNMHPKMIGLTGSEEQIKAAAKAYKVYFKAQKGDDPEFYPVDHSTFTYFMMPGQGFVDFFRREDTADKMADKVACYLDAAN